MIPSSTELEYFLEIGKTLNLSRAAERLGVSQPSLSMAIQRLEKTIDTPLLIRGKRGVTLTPAGKLVLSQTRALIEDWEKIKVSAHAAQNKIQGHFKIGCHPSVALYCLSLFLPKLLESNPDLNIQLIHDLSRKITEEVIRFQIDIGIVINPVKHPDLVIHSLGEDKVTFWRSQKYKKENQSDILYCDPSLLQTQSLIKKLSKTQLSNYRIVTSNSLEVIADLTANGKGIGVLPSRVALYHHSNRIVPIPQAPVYKDNISLIYRVENKSILTIKEITQQVMKTF